MGGDHRSGSGPLGHSRGIPISGEIRGKGHPGEQATTKAKGMAMGEVRGKGSAARAVLMDLQRPLTSLFLGERESSPPFKPA